MTSNIGENFFLVFYSYVMARCRYWRSSGAMMDEWQQNSRFYAQLIATELSEKKTGQNLLNELKQYF
jgi:hypothetical protein